MSIEQKQTNTEIPQLISQDQSVQRRSSTDVSLEQHIPEIPDGSIGGLPIVSALSKALEKESLEKES